MAAVEITIAPFQDEFINSSEQYVAIVGAKGSSKTWAGTRFTLRQVGIQPTEQHLVMFNTLQQARDVFYQDFEPLLKQLEWPYHFNDQKTNLRVFDTLIHFRSAERDAIERIESISYASGWADEVSFYDKNSLDVFMSRIRKGSGMVRITSMPDEPDHWMYDSLDRGGFKMHEISLYDNPDKVFVKGYEKKLKSIYQEEQLKRYLDGDRVSLAGIGLFAVRPDMKSGISINPDLPIYIMWDFNVAYRAVSFWQEVGRNEQAVPIVACVRSRRMKNATVYQDAVEIAESFKTHKSEVYLGGDASENKRSSQTTESIWMTVRRAFRDVGVQAKSIVPRANPRVKDTIECANWALINGLVIFAEDEKNVYSSLQAARADKYGEIDKSRDNTPGGAKSHEADTARYFFWHEYKHLYPGGSGKSWAV